jgi:hypothetical protein
MADETKKYILLIESNLKKYAEEAAEAKKRVDELKSANDLLKKSGQDSGPIWEQNKAELKNAQNEYNKSTRLVTLQTQAINSETNSKKQLNAILAIEMAEREKLANVMVKNKDGTLVLNKAFSDQQQKIANTKQAILDYDKSLNDGRSNVGRYSEAIEGAMGKFSAMPGPVGQAATAVKGFGASMKALLLNPIVLVVTALVAALTALFKIFKSTSEGAGKIKDIMASLHAIMNVLRERVVSLMESFGHLFKGEFKKAGEDMKATFTGLGEAIGNASRAAAEFSAQQRQLSKELAMHISEEANENLKIQEYLMLSKDKTKADKERLNYLKEAMKTSEEQANKAVEYAKRQFNIDVGNAALKADIDQKTLADWVAMDAEQQKIALEGSEKLRAAYNLLGGSDALKLLEESQAKITNAQAEYFQTNKRTTSQISTLENELQKERETRIRELTALRLMESEGNLKATKEALKYQLDEELKMTGVSDAKKKMLKIQYDRDIAELDKKAKDEADKAATEWEAKDAKRKEHEYELQKELAQKQKQDIEDGFEYQRLKSEGNLDALDKILDQEYGALLASEEYQKASQNRKLLLDEQYNQAKKELSEIRINQTIQEADIIAGLFSSMSNAMGKQTALGKTFAVAQAIMDTYAGATAAFTDKSIPSTALRFVAAASVILNGLANVRQILAVKVPGGGGASSMPTSISSSQAAQKSVAVPVGSTILNQPQLTQTQLNAMPNQNLLTAQDIANALSKMPPPVVTVEDINKVSNQVNKVKIRANI